MVDRISFVDIRRVPLTLVACATGFASVVNRSQACSCWIPDGSNQFGSGRLKVGKSESLTSFT